MPDAIETRSTRAVRAERYRHGAELVEAFRWAGTMSKAPDWAWEAAERGALELLPYRKRVAVETAEGKAVARVGDWLVRGEDGAIRVSTDDEFAKRCKWRRQPRKQA